METGLEQVDNLAGLIERAKNALRGHPRGQCRVDLYHITQGCCVFDTEYNA